jgi:hypothetical protein
LAIRWHKGLRERQGWPAAVAILACGEVRKSCVLDDRFHEIGGHGTGLLLGDSSFAVG